MRLTNINAGSLVLTKQQGVGGTTRAAPAFKQGDSPQTGVKEKGVITTFKQEILFTRQAGGLVDTTVLI